MKKDNIDNTTKVLNIWTLLYTLTIFIILTINWLFVFVWNTTDVSHITEVDIYNTGKFSSDFKLSDTILKTTTFTLTAIGDIMCHDTQYKDAYNSSTLQYDFNYVFDDIKHHIKDSDLTIGNLETTFGGAEKGYRNYPTFNTPDALANAISNLGVDVLSTASNHSLDTGYDGLVRTSNLLNNLGIKYVGTADSQEKRDSLLYVNVKGINIAILSYTYGTNGIPIPKGKEYSVNLIDKDLILKDIKKAKQNNVDMIIACMHWGTEYSISANNEQKDLTNMLFENGVNVILGNHPHVVQPMEKRTVTTKDGKIQDGFVIYALGNFISDQIAPNTRNSIILDLNITKTATGEIKIDNINYTPIYMYKTNTSSKQRMKLLDIQKNISNFENKIPNSINNSTYNILSKELAHIKSILGK